MKEKIVSSYMPLIKKCTFYSLLIITVINIGLRVYFHFEHPVFRTINYTINIYSFYLMGYLIIFWLFFLVKTLWKIGSEKYPEKYSNVLGEFCLVLSIPLAIVTVVLGVIFTFITIIEFDEEECMEMCVMEDQSNYNECLFGTCDF